MLNDEVVVQFSVQFEPQHKLLLRAHGLELVETLSSSDRIFLCRIADAKVVNPFDLCRALQQDASIVYAEPNMILEGSGAFIPNDLNDHLAPYLEPWHLNTGQAGGFADADMDCDQAWDASQGLGRRGIRIALLDNGFDMQHVDLAANIVQGYDFYSADADASPVSDYDNHGTGVAGIAAAIANNGGPGYLGVAGNCRILPVRIYTSTNDLNHGYFAAASDIYRALVYAADNADVISCSWYMPPNQTISNGFTYARDTGRDHRGCLAIAASGNLWGGDGPLSYETLTTRNIFSSYGAGTYTFTFRFSKLTAASGNDNCFWLADVTLPSNVRERFDSPTVPGGWSSAGTVPWSGSLDTAHAHGTSRYAWRSGAISSGQISTLSSPAVSVDSTHTSISFRVWVSCDPSDQAAMDIYRSGILVGTYIIGSGAPPDRLTSIGYPASYTNSVIAVGASTDFDYRSHYGQFGPGLSFVAPSVGGYADIPTTDRSGAAGYNKRLFRKV